MTKDLRSLIFDFTEMFLSFHITFNFDKAFYAFAILDNISFFEPLSDTKAAK